MKTQDLIVKIKREQPFLSDSDIVDKVREIIPDSKCSAASVNSTLSRAKMADSVSPLARVEKRLEGTATKTDPARVKSRLGGVMTKADLYRGLLFQAGAIVAALAALNLLQ